MRLRTGLVVRLGAWLLPWLAVLGLSSGLAFAMDAGLVHAWTEATEAAPTQASTLGQWVVIEVPTEQGVVHRVRCRARPGFFSHDQLAMDPAELEVVAASACEVLEVASDG